MDPAAALLGQRCSRNNLKASHNSSGYEDVEEDVGTKVFKEQSESKSQRVVVAVAVVVRWDKGVQGTI